ncbi:MAG: ATP-dependent DNA ligase [Actinomycetota bacterium]|nr:ATP-dependent DNA ligase [Actinomycetota bacterium]
MLLAEVVATSAKVSETRSRTAKIAALADLIGRLVPDEVVAVIGMLVAAPRQGRLGVGWSTLSRIGGGCAERAELSVADVDAIFGALATTSGTGSAASRQALLASLFERATAAERPFLLGVLMGEVRQGALEGVLADAIAAGTATPVHLLRRAWMLTGSLTETARLAVTGGASALTDVGLQVLRPVKPMLAASAATVEAALGDTGEAVVDYKLDGARIQVHRDGDQIAVFTRSLKDATARLPEVVDIVAQLPAQRLILDGESLVLDDTSSRPRSFADTQSRFGAQAAREELLRPYFFDLLHVDGVDLIDEPLHVRLAELERVAGPWRVPSVRTDDPGVAARVLAESLAAGHEGVVVKSVDSTYAAGRRGSGWQKVKPVRTLDMVVLAAEWGHGRRSGWLSNLHLGARDPDGAYGEPGGFVMVGKTFKGMTDAMLGWQTEALQAIEVRRTAGTVWVRPELVVEIAFDAAQVSTRYPGGAALRFARVLRYREDKDAAESDTISAVREALPASGPSR